MRKTNTTPKNKADFSWRLFCFRFLLAAVVVGASVFFVARTFTTPPPEVVDERWNTMVANIEERAAHFNGDAGVFIKDLKTGRTYERNANKTFLSASLIKLPIMVATFDAIKNNKISLESKIKLKSSLRRRGSGELKWARVGTKYSVSQLINKMITRSDNTATAMVVNQLGYDYLNERFHLYGLKETRIEPTGMSLSDRIDPALDNYTTAQEMASLLERIYKRQAVDATSSELMLDVMKQTKERKRLAKNLPASFQLARKTGLLRKNCHDVGIVFSPEGDFIVCVLTGNGKNYNLAKVFISGVGEEAYHYIGS